MDTVKTKVIPLCWIEYLSVSIGKDNITTSYWLHHCLQITISASLCLQTLKNLCFILLTLTLVFRLGVEGGLCDDDLNLYGRSILLYSTFSSKYSVVLEEDCKAKLPHDPL